MSVTTNNLKLIFGGAVFSSEYGFNPETVVETLHSFHHQEFSSIDTGQAYGDSETLLGKAKASSMGFEVDTKVAGGLWPHVHHTKEAVIKAGEDSVKALGVDQVRLHFNPKR